jgi:ATP-dependent DNA helicase RecG
MLLCSPAGYDDLRQLRTSWRALAHGPEVRVLVQARMCPPDDVKAYTADRRVLPREPHDQRYTKKTRRLSVPLADSHGHVANLTVFGNIWGWKDLERDQLLTLAVTPKRFMGQLYFNEPEFISPAWIGRVRPRYRGLPGRVAAERIEEAVLEIIDSPAAYEHCRQVILSAFVGDEATILARAGVEEPSIAAVLMNLHGPTDIEAGQRAIGFARRISALAVQSAAIARNVRAPDPRAVLRVDVAGLEEELSRVVPALTQDQRDCALGVAVRLTSTRPLNALLSGDVGTGKTLAYLLPAVAAWRAGAQVSIVVPTMILADQIARELDTRFPDVDSARVNAGEPVVRPSAIQVGTVGLVNEAVRSGYVPNLLIVDEQQKLSTAQREGMAGAWTHVLEVSATPIPRTLAIARYSGIEHFVLRECPVKKEIRSGVLDGANDGRETLSRWIRYAVESRQRVLLVYPSVESEMPVSKKAARGAQAAPDETSGSQPPLLPAAQRVEGEARATRTLLAAAEGIERRFPGEVVLLHGAMKDDEKRRALESFRAGDRHIMVASSVVEIGVDLPDVRLVAVAGAERFGLSQLHQFRGRTARQGGKGAFAMFVEDFERLPSDAKERLVAVATIRDGFELAERDMQLRGFGGTDGSEQSGDADTLFKCINLTPDDFFLLKDEEVAAAARRADDAPAEDSPIVDPERYAPEQMRLV